METGPRYRIEAEGNAVISDENIRIIVDPTEERTPFDRRARKRAAAEIVLRYQELGYLMASVKVEEDRDPDGMEVTVRFVVDEGRPYLLRKRNIVFEGHDAGPFSTKTLRNQIVGFVAEKIRERGLYDRSLLHSKHRALPLTELDALDREEMYLDPPSPAVRYPARDVFVPDLFEAALDSVADLYREKGYWTVRVDPPSITKDDELGVVSISIYIDPGPKQVLGDVIFTGTDTPREKLLDAVAAPLAPSPALAMYKPLSPLAVDNGRIGLLEYFESEGYPWVEVDYEIDRSDPKTAVVRFDVRPGDRVTISDVVVRGNVITSESLIRAQLGFKPGDVLNASDFREAKARLVALGVFVAVDIDYEDPDTRAPTKRVTVTVKEDDYTTLEWSLGYATDDGPRGYVVAGYSNLGGLAWSVIGRLAVNLPRAGAGIAVFNPGGVPDEWPRLVSSGSDFSTERDNANRNILTAGEVLDAIERKVILGLTKRKLVNNFLGTPLDFNVELVHSRDTELSYGLTKYGGVLRIGSSPSLSRGTAWALVSYQLEADFFYNIFTTYDEEDLEALALDFRPKLFPDTAIPLVSVRPTFSFDTRDDRFNPTSGILASISGDWVVSIGRGRSLNPDVKDEDINVNAIRTVVMLNGYIPIRVGKRPWVVALSFSGGSVFSVVRGTEIPPDRSFFLGGRSSIRSYFQESMLPEDFAREVGYGSPDRSGEDRDLRVPASLYVLARTELRFPISTFEGAIFVDAGNSWADITEAHRIPFWVRTAVGAAIRYPSPVGPISVEFGINLFRKRCADGAHAPWNVDETECDVLIDDTSAAWHLAIGVF